MTASRPRYVLKPDPQSSHSIILRLGEGRGLVLARPKGGVFPAANG